MLWLQFLFLQHQKNKLSRSVHTVAQRHTAVSSSSVEELVAELRGQREEEQSQEEQAQHGSQQHHAVQPVVPPGQDTHRPHGAQQPRHAATGTTAQRDGKTAVIHCFSAKSSLLKNMLLTVIVT